MAEKPQKKQKSKIRSALSHLVTVILCLILMGTVYVAAILLQPDSDSEKGSFVVQEEKEAITRMQSAAMTDIPALAGLFGAPLPYLPGVNAAGQGENTAHDGETVRICTVTYPGVIITAVRPVSASPLLLRESLSLSMRSDLTVLNLPAALAEKGDARCVYFMNEDAAYSVYAVLAEEDFLRVLDSLSWTN